MVRGALTGTQLKSLKDTVKIDIRSLLFSSKDGLTERELKQEYKELNGTDLPFVELGYNSVYDLLKEFNFIKSRRHANGKWIFYAIYDESTKELGRLVQGQHDPKKSLREKKRYNETRNYNRPNQTSFNPTYATTSNQTTNCYKFVPYSIQKMIVECLKRFGNSKKSLNEFDIEFKKSNGFDLNSKKFGFNSLTELMDSLNHLVYMEYSRAANSYLVGLKTQSLENEIVENLKILIEKYPDGISLRSVQKLYCENFQNKKIEYEKLGFESLIAFLTNKLASLINIKNLNEIDYLITKRAKQDSDKDEDEDSSDENEYFSELEEEEQKIKNEVVYKNLIDSLENAFKNFIDEKLKEEDFLKIYESVNGYSLDYKDYQFKDFSQLKTLMHEIGIITVEFDSDFNVLYTYSSNYINQKKLLSSKNKQKMLNQSLNVEEFEKENYVNLNNNERELYEWRKNQAEFIQEYVIYETDLDLNGLIPDILEKREHQIIVSCVTNPCNIYVQLAKNVDSLNKLMDELEKCYFGVGASYYDMPVEYVKQSKLCVAMYDIDKNWHRCRIIGVNEEKNYARVSFIDYGGEANVPINSLKFLLKQFGKLPIQAFKARFANIKPIPEDLWRKDIINYLLNRVMNKSLEARIIGIRSGLVSMEIYERCQDGTRIHLNKRIVMDGYGELYDEESDFAFKDFNAWKEDNDYAELLKSLNNKNTPSDVSTRSMLSSEPTEPSMSQKKEQNNSVDKLKYSLIDELNENSVLKQKIVQFPDNLKLNLLSLDGKFYVHYFQIADLFNMNYEIFEKVFLFNNNINHILKDDDVCFTKFPNNSNNQELYDWIYMSIDPCIDNYTETYLIVYSKLSKFLELCLKQEKCKTIQQCLNEALKPSNKKLASSVNES